uniref:RNA-directed DNA polymerase n=1 Tax=Ananas comosus var. bracteatus TaxID=296719 RepID=A0A6V7Q2G8_ANACO|nr:unnamed protein product [Ananas comosus var. bracteatus]
METRAQEQKKLEEMLRQLVKESATRQDEAIQELRERQHMDMEEVRQMFVNLHASISSGGGHHSPANQRSEGNNAPSGKSRLTRAIPSWEEYILALSTRFGSDLFDDPMAELKGLRQIGSVLEYQDKFDALLNRVELSEEYAVSCFISGLKDEIQIPIRMFQPRTLQRALSLAKLQEVAIEGHKEESSDAAVVMEETYTSNDTCSEGSEPTPQISLHALAGQVMLPDYRTMRLSRTVKNKKVHILIDSGSTHNFLDTTIATKLGCSLEEVPAVKVTVADGNKLLSSSICRSFKWKMQGLEFNADLLLLSLRGCDMVLGIQWLIQLGPILWDFKQLRMEFQVKDRKVVLKGSQGADLKMIEGKELKKIVQGSTTVAAAHLCSIHAVVSEIAGPELIKEEETKKQQVSELFSQQLQLLLEEYADLFADPQAQLEYLGHIIRQEGVAMDKQKVEAILKWPQPVSVKELRGFLGLAGYYRRFVKNFGKISKPLHEMLGKGGFKWTEASLQALQQLKAAVATAPVLALPDFSAEFIVETDASGVGVGAVLLQKGRPIAFMSKPLSPRNQQLSTYEREMLAIVIAIQKWRPYLIGRHFKVKTDHQSLKYLLEQRVSTPSQQKWISKLMGYDYELVYKNGRENVVADALSRAPSLQAISAIHTDLLEQIKLSWNQDDRIKKILADKQRGGHSGSHYTWTQGLLKRKGKLVVGPSLTPSSPSYVFSLPTTSSASMLPNTASAAAGFKEAKSSQNLISLSMARGGGAGDGSGDLGGGSGGNHGYLMSFESEGAERGKGFVCKREIYATLYRPARFDGVNKKRMSGICMEISSKGLAITGVDDRRYWNHISIEESDTPS